MIIHKKQLGFATAIIILIVAIVIVAGGAGYYFYKTSLEQKEIERVEPEQVIDKTADWKTYKNEKANYQIKIPQDWKIGEYETPVEGVSFPGSTTFLIPGYNESEACFRIMVDLGVHPEVYSSLHECKNFSGLKTIHCPSPSGLLETLPKISSESPLGYQKQPLYPGWTVYASLPCKFSPDVFPTDGTLRTYRFFVRHKPGGYSEAEKILKQILPTFKFIK